MRNLVQTKKKNAQDSTKVLYGCEGICEVSKEMNFWGAEGEFQEWLARGSGKQDQPEVVVFFLGYDLALVSGNSRARSLVHLLFCYS